ncbi:TPA: tRNA uridine(34) 5-carboxymethylaminomethyl modification radical SAM/GNAT enzyme Elp3 [Thermoplasmata archaeon]|nr:tRNA uridine(34) 5-carboxymethylaminomethyl modification radical SAM/GNAT enzyme Elp3 [Thermoplasmata archaeon]
MADFIDLLVRREICDRDAVLRAKTSLCKKHGLSRVPTNYEILGQIPEDLRREVEHLLRNKPSRTLSGVAPVAVMTSPSDCPHGRCIYCPGGVANNSPQSYTGREPAALRGSMYDFDPFEQTSARLKQLRAIGHRTDKVDLIIMGGTFTARPAEYQEWFVRRCFDAMNGHDSEDIETSHTANETAESRCVGLTVETRPDWFGPDQIASSIALGATKVELGVQILDDRVLDGVKRGHHVADVESATRLAREAGLKVCYHVMPGLPGSSYESDLQSFSLMFEDERFRPDMLKIYPTLVVAGTELHDLWERGGYSPMSMETTTRLVSEMKSRVPPWVRILRVQRDIPVQLIEAGVKKSHLREIVTRHLASSGKACRCIRCREVGRSGTDGNAPSDCDRAVMSETSYRANGGTETFLSCHLDPDGSGLIGYARLRCPDETPSSQASVRELHVYGPMVPLAEDPGGRWQHRGIGERLLSLCESRAESSGYSSVRVTSGVGVRDYYRRLGYSRDGMYMTKSLRGA